MAKKQTASIIDTSNYDYETLRVRGKDGKLHHIKGNADSIMKALAMHTVVHGKTIEQVARANKLELNEHSNVGQLRMAVGNSLRAKVRKGEPVTIGDIVVKSLEQRIAIPVEANGGGARPAKKTAKKAAKKAKPRKARARAEASEAEATA